MRRLYTVALFLILSTGTVWPHGINGHINVTHWMTADENVQRVWREPGCRNAMVFGSVFPDTGYGVNHEYGELTHWAPFLDALIDHINTMQVEEVVFSPLVKCFVVGLAVHGLQDEMFDTFFLEQVDYHDAVGQDIVDPGLDAIMVVDGVAQFKPEVYVPDTHIISVLAESFRMEVSPDLLAEAARRVKLAVIDHFAPIAANYADTHRDSLEWASLHYLDETVVGSLASEIGPTGAYGGAVWARLHGQPLQSDIVSSFGGRFIEALVPIEQRIYGVVLARAVRVGSIRGGVAVRRKGTESLEFLPVEPGIWTRSDDAYTRVIRIEVPPTRRLDDFELRAPQEWQWIDGNPSIGSWFSLNPNVTLSPTSAIPRDASLESGCRVHEGPKRNGQTWLLLLLTLAVCRLKPQDRIASSGLKASNGRGVRLL